MGHHQQEIDQLQQEPAVLVGRAGYQQGLRRDPASKNLHREGLFQLLGILGMNLAFSYTSLSLGLRPTYAMVLRLPYLDDLTVLQPALVVSLATTLDVVLVDCVIGSTDGYTCSQGHTNCFAVGVTHWLFKRSAYPTHRYQPISDAVLL